MAKRPHTNTTGRIQHLGGCTLFPNQTRDIDEKDIPRARAAALPPEPAPPDPADELVGKPLKEILPALSELTTDQLARLEALELDGRARKSLLEAISELRLSRARSLRDNYAATLQTMSDDELAAEMQRVGEDPECRDLIDAECERRHADT